MEIPSDVRSSSPALFLAALIAIALLLSQSIRFSAATELVAFNTESHKFHCPTYKWANRCTQNCIRISRSEAVKLGGVPCKVCGGICR